MYVIPYQVADKLKELETQERVLKSRMLTAAAQRTSLASGHAFVSFTTPGEVRYPGPRQIVCTVPSVSTRALPDLRRRRRA